MEAAAGGGSFQRATQSAMGLLYVFLFLNVYENYISVMWGYTGLYFRPLHILEILFVAGAVIAVSAALPERMERPSAIITWLLYAFVFVPTVALTFMLGARPAVDYLPSLVALTAVFVMLGVVSQLRRSEEAGAIPSPTSGFALSLVGAFLLASFLQFWVFRDIITFASIENIYDQRFMASEIGGGAIGYLRTHYYYVVATGLFALGLTLRRYWTLSILGVSAFIFSYMIDASKLALITPALMVIIYVLLKKGAAKTTVMTGGLLALTSVSSLLTSQAAIVRYFADLVLFRSIAIPGQTFHQYYDLFSSAGFTWWSNVRFINLYVPPPAAFQADPFWPVLGKIVGREFYNGSVTMNANANPFSGEGVAAGGAVGVIVIGVLVALTLRGLDLAARGWNRTFVLLVATPLGLCLTNGHLSTFLLSFGGIFWLLFFHYYKPHASA